MTVFAKKYQNKNKKSRAYGKTYARAVMVGTVGIEELAEAMSESCTVTRSDIVAVLSALGPAMRRMLQKSLRVQLPYLGTFKLGLTTIGEEDAEDFDMQHNVKGVHVLFHPETKVNTRGQWENDLTDMKPELHERKYEIDSLCYPIRLAYEYWLVTGDDSIFGELWQVAMQAVLRTFKEQQRKGGNKGPYKFMRRDIDAKSSLTWYGWGPPVNPVGLIVSCFRPSDDATVLPFLVPSNFMAVSSLRKAGEILNKVNHNAELAGQCLDLAQEVEDALHKYAIVDHPKYGQIYAYEVDGWGGRVLADDANVPSLLAMGYLGDVPMDDPIYRNTRRFVWSEDNPCFFKGKAGEGIGGAHTAYNLIWPMSIMMKAFTADNDEEIAWCMRQLLTTDAGTGFMHESFHKDDATHYTRAWFAWQNTLFGELVIHLVENGKANLLVHCLD